MQIVLDNCGRRYNQDWIFRNLSYTFKQGEQYAILGPNGSGKSTLMGVIAGTISPSEGKSSHINGEAVEQDKLYNHISFAAPYMELIEEFTLAETVKFHFHFKNYAPQLDYNGLLDVLGLTRATDKPLKYFSSGMKQRTRLALAFGASTPVLMVDEPTANLDEQGFAWYLNLVERFTQNRLFIVASNQQHEYGFCHNLVNISTYKPAERV